MTTEATYTAMRELIKVSAELEAGKAVIARCAPLEARIAEQAAEIRSLRDELLTRAAPVDMARLEETIREEIIRVERNSPPGKAGRDGVDGKDGRDGKDGIPTREELRAEVAKAVTSSGPIVQKLVAAAIDALPVLQYEGVFREGTTYKAGECVTWGGSVWHANAATQEKPGEGKTAWTLMVKRGDKGKDAT